MRRPLIKVCGMRDADNIRRVEALGVDLIGFIFYAESARHVSEPPGYMPVKARRVGVFVDEDISVVQRVARTYALDYIQLHGSESPEYVNQAARTAPVIKAFSIASEADLQATAAYEGLARLFLFDAKGAAAGGNGKHFPWAVLRAYRGSTPFLLSGGIAPTDAEAARRALRHDACIGLDLNSRFEVAPAMKDIHRLETFINTLRQ